MCVFSPARAYDYGRQRGEDDDDYGGSYGGYYGEGAEADGGSSGGGGGCNYFETLVRSFVSIL